MDAIGKPAEHCDKRVVVGLDITEHAERCPRCRSGGRVMMKGAAFTWRKGEEMMDKIRLEVRLRSKDLLERLKADPPLRIPGTAVVRKSGTRLTASIKESRPPVSQRRDHPPRLDRQTDRQAV